MLRIDPDIFFSLRSVVDLNLFSARLSITVWVGSMKLFSCVLISVLLGGCATTSVFDPAPYRPNIDASVLSSLNSTSVNILQFSSLDDASKKLQAISDGYAAQRDSLMRQQLLFDIPMMGLAAATIASGIYGGSKGLTLGLGLGASALAGGRLYFGPQTKVAAYNTAALTLSCASSVANEMDSIKLTQEDNNLTSQLSENIASADKAFDDCGQSLTTIEVTNLYAARNQAIKAYGDLLSALVLLETAPVQLKTFATTVISGATNKIVTGTQNVAASLAIINATPTTIPAVKSTGTGTGPQAALAPSDERIKTCSVEVSQVISQLQYLSSKASQISKNITDKWMVLSTCSASSS